MKVKSKSASDKELQKLLEAYKKEREELRKDKPYQWKIIK